MRARATLFLALIYLAVSAYAQEPEQKPDEPAAPAEPQAPVTAAPSGASDPAPAKAPRKAKGKPKREKAEAEGTEAPNRFEANTVIKSQYELNGQPLEVDPD